MRYVGLIKSVCEEEAGSNVGTSDVKSRPKLLGNLGDREILSSGEGGGGDTIVCLSFQIWGQSRACNPSLISSLIFSLKLVFPRSILAGDSSRRSNVG